MLTYPIEVAGYTRHLPICKVSDDLYIGAFVIFGDVELTVACASALLDAAPEYDYLISPEAKSIPLIYEMARQSGGSQYFLVRKAPKLYMRGYLETDVTSITTARPQKLYLDSDDAALMRDKRILIVDDVISTGESVLAVERLVNQAGGNVVGKMAILAEGDASSRDDIIFLARLPVFDANAAIRKNNARSRETAPCASGLHQ
jgi:adenine phosphoribosyltransferase